MTIYSRYLLSGVAAISFAAAQVPQFANAQTGKEIQIAQRGSGHSGSGHSGSGHAGSGHSGGKRGSGHGGDAGALGGPSADSDGKGPRNQPGSGTRGKPTWAQEGIPEVELGRLNVARSPSNVLDRQLAEVLKT